MHAAQMFFCICSYDFFLRRRFVNERFQGRKNALLSVILLFFVGSHKSSQVTDYKRVIFKFCAKWIKNALNMDW